MRSEEEEEGGEKKVGSGGRLTMRKRTEAESCIAQNLCSLTINLQQRDASPSPSPRMRVAR